jgi:hypothetical protein
MPLENKAGDVCISDQVLPLRSEERSVWRCSYMRRTNSSDSSSVPGSMWLNRRSSENPAVRIRLGGSLTGCGGTRSISIIILPRLANSEGGGSRSNQLALSGNCYFVRKGQSQSGAEAALSAFGRALPVDSRATKAMGTRREWLYAVVNSRSRSRAARRVRGTKSRRSSPV